MKTAFMAVSFVCVVLLAVVGIGVSKYLALSTDFEAEKAASAAVAPIGAKSAESAEVAKLKKRVVELEKELELAKSAGPATAPPAAAKGGKKGEGKGMMKNLVKMMADPGMRDAMRQQQRLALKGMYADLFEDLGLSHEKENEVMELLLDKQMMHMELGMGMMGKDLTKADRLQMGEEIAKETKLIDEEIKSALGEEDFANYELFVDSQQERMQLNSFKESLKAVGEPLSYEVEEQLMNVMYETRKEFKFTTDFGTDANPNPKAWAGFDKAGADKLIAEMRQLQNQVATKAGAILSPGQLEAFKAAQESQLKMQEMGIRMGLQMQE